MRSAATRKRDEHHDGHTVADREVEERRGDKCKRGWGARRSIIVPDQPNQRWRLDFVGNALAKAGGNRQ